MAIKKGKLTRKLGNTIFNDDAEYLKCSRCGHEWKKRGKHLPEICPNLKCKSPYWNHERVRDKDDMSWNVSRTWSKTNPKVKIAKFTEDDKELVCQCCGHTWKKRLSNKLPMLCPKCRNPNWNYIQETEDSEDKSIET